MKNIEIYSIKGPHPSENISVHIEKIRPIGNSKEKTWTICPEDVVNIGFLFTTGQYAAQRTVAVAGPDVKNPIYYQTKIGADVQTLIKNIIIESDVPNRFISGDLLTGVAVDSEVGHINFYKNLLSIIPEGNNYRTLGWLPFRGNSIPSASRLSFSSFFKKQRINTNLNGEERAFVITGEMEKVFPMDIYPMQLLKACLEQDIEKMENLGIYEVVPEDFGIIDYVSTSKIEAQEIIKKGIRLMVKEIG